MTFDNGQNQTEQRLMTIIDSASQFDRLGNYEEAVAHYKRALIIVKGMIEKPASNDPADKKRIESIALKLVDSINRVTKLVATSSRTIAPIGVSPTPSGEPANSNEFQKITHTGVTFNDVIGCEEIKDFVKTSWIDRFKPEYATVVIDGQTVPIYETKLEKGILLYGLPGTGKTMISKAIASEVNAVFYNIDAKQIVDKYKGETAKALGRLFDAAGKEKRAIIFVDEIDSILTQPGDDVQQHQKMDLNQWLSLMDGMNSVQYANVLFIGTTNYPNTIADSALRPGRMGAHFRVDLPNLATRMQIVKKKIRSNYVANEIRLEDIARRLAQYSTADVIAACERIINLRSAKIVEAKRQGKHEIQSADVAVTKVEIDELLEFSHTSIKESTVHEIDRFEKNLKIKNKNGSLPEYHRMLLHE